MAYRYHPEIEGLKTNEDGTEVVFNGKKLNVRKLNREARKADLMYVAFIGKTHSVAKLVCECWIGMAENPRWVATRRDKTKGFHYTNLFWAPRGKNPEMGTDKVKRSSLSKLSNDDVEKIKKRLKKGHFLKDIAKDYNTSEMTISRIRKKIEN